MNEEEILSALKDYFGEDAEIERDESSDMYGMLGFDVDGDEYIVGDSDTAYDAAVEEAISTFEDAYDDSSKIDWLQEWNWPGVDTDGMMEDINADFDDFEYDDIDEYISDFGEKASEVFSYDFVKSYIDMRELGEFVVDNDGIANGLARYDGKEIDLGNDLLAYRVN